MKRNKLLYKYVDFDTLNIILDNRTHKFTNPLSFNDPFDCNYPSYSLTEQKFKKIIMPFIRKKFRNELKALKNDANSVINNIISQEFSELRENIIQLIENPRKDWDNLISNYRILSLTIDDRNILMWSHYADNHKGAVLGFDMYQNEDYKSLKDVFYDKNDKKFQTLIEDRITKVIEDVIRDDINSNFDIIANQYFKELYEYFYIKKTDWKYENEYRIVLKKNHKNLKSLDTDEFNLYQFNDLELKTITFGVKMEDINKVESSKKIVSNFPHVTIYESFKEYNNLEIKEYSNLY